MFKERLNELTEVIDKCLYSTHADTLDPKEALEMSHFLIRQVTKVGGIIYVIGNGGSAGIASHFCTDLLRTLGISAATFYDPGILTCFANDYGYENVFKMPLMKNMRSNDLLVAISSSGQSKNIVEAAKAAKERKVTVITLSGFLLNNPLRKLGDLNFWLESSDYGIVEMGHFFLLHTLIDTCKIKSESLALSAT